MMARASSRVPQVTASSHRGIESIRETLGFNVSLSYQELLNFLLVIQ
jgi:hypothetical protein